MVVLRSCKLNVVKIYPLSDVITRRTISREVLRLNAQDPSTTARRVRIHQLVISGVIQSELISDYETPTKTSETLVERNGMQQNTKLTKEQKAIIIGTLLGDGHLESQTAGKTYRLKIEHSLSQKYYVDWLYQKLENWVLTPPKVKTKIVHGKQYINYGFQTISTASFRFFGQSFYTNRQKLAPKMMRKLLTPLALAVWFMDDGSIKSRHHKALILNTQCFDAASLQRLQVALLENFRIQTIQRKQKEGRQIYILSKSVDQFLTIIRPYVLKGMEYKLGKSRVNTIAKTVTEAYKGRLSMDGNHT